VEVVRLTSAGAPAARTAALTVGNFDGVHRGHQALVRATVAVGRELGAPSVVLTFDPHPEAVVGSGAPARLMSARQKEAALAALGVDCIAVLSFTREVAALAVVVGEGFRFGRGRAGDVPLLVALGGALGFTVRAVPAATEGGAPVSSTRVRAALEKGAVDEARVLLGRPFALEGEVVEGAGRGRTLGVPTANVRPASEALPALGVYACWAKVEDGDQRWPAAVNVGRRPTFGGGDTLVEAHLVGFAGDLYGRRLDLSFAARVRGETAFPDAGALVRQVKADVAEVQRLLGVG
jgi:riboflavin kinase/FMN adenylyltransferase